MVRIAVVNDNPELLDLMGDICQDDGYSTTLIESLRGDVFEQICRSEPDLLLINLRHGTDAIRGWEIVQELRRTSGCEDLPVVMCSADVDALNRVEPDLQQDGRIVPLKLPFELEELEGSIKALAARGEAFGCS